MEQLNKISLPTTVIIASLIIGGFYYASESNKQKSIEAQQLKDYTAEQKAACLEIYTTESDKWNNVRGWSYDEERDKCEITYADSNKKTEAECDAQFKGDDGLVPPILFELYLHCVNGTFTNEF